MSDKLQIAASFAKKEGFKTDTFTDLVVHEERLNAVLISARGVVPDSMTCWYCNKPLTTMESQAIGVGPVCAKQIGIPKKVNSKTAKEWYGVSANLVKQWLPRRVIKLPHHLRMAIAPEDQPNVEFKIWEGDISNCNGILTIGYEPTEMHLRYENLICLEIFCTMGMGFQNELAELEGCEWHGGDFEDPSWRNARDIGKDKVWTFTFSPDTASKIFDICSQWQVELEVQQELIDLVITRKKAKNQRQEIIEGLGVFSTEDIKKMPPEELDKVDWNKIVKTNPWSHQKAAVLFVAARMNLKVPLQNEEE